MNELLRQHVTRVGFNLTLSKNQIAELVHLDAQLADGRALKERIGDGRELECGHRHILSNGTTYRRGLMGRGLVAHHPSAEGADRGDDLMNSTTRDNWSITVAGHAVVALLKESGLWVEVAAEIPWVKPPEPRPSFTPAEEIAHLHNKVHAAEMKYQEMRDERNRERTRACRAENATQQAEVRYRRIQERVRGVMEMVEPDSSEVTA